MQPDVAPAFRPLVLRHAIRPLLWSLLLAALLLVALPARAAEKVDKLPAVNNFATARFKVLSTIESTLDDKDIKVYSFGEGATVQPDRVSLWVGTNGTKELVYFVQVGNAVYQRQGSEPWERSESSAPANAQPLSAQFNDIAALANAILKINSEPVNGKATDHYQVWIGGQRLVDASGGEDELGSDAAELLKNSTFKFDFWISPQDGFLYQQNIEVALPSFKVDDVEVPAIRSNTLITYYDINDPSISINAPR